MRVLLLLLPALIPSWRFFRAVAASPRVERWEQGCWRDARPRPAEIGLGRMLRRLFWNPRWNEALFLVSLAERVVEQGSERAARELLRRAAPEGQPLRLVFVSYSGGALVREVLWEHPPPKGGSPDAEAPP